MGWGEDTVKRAEALREIARLHEEWSIQHGDSVPNEGSESVWQADMYAPASVDDPLNEQIKEILAQIEEDEDEVAVVEEPPDTVRYLDSDS